MKISHKHTATAEPYTAKKSLSVFVHEQASQVSTVMLKVAHKVKQIQRKVPQVGSIALSKVRTAKTAVPNDAK